MSEKLIPTSIFDKIYLTLNLERIGSHLLVLRLSRPEFSNALNTQMGLEMRDVWTSLYTNQEDLRCVIMTGEGEKAFCAGGDLKERNSMTDEQWRYQHAIFEQNIEALMDCPIPIIAAVNGAAYGGGCEFAVACDFAYASDNARFALTEVSLGIIPGTGGTQNLPRAVGVRRAKEIILTASPFDAAQALEWGLVNKVCQADTLLSEAINTAQKICGNGPIAVRQAKSAVGMSTQVDIKSGYAFELEAYNRCVPTEDRLEGVAAFNEKRKAVFKGK